jgi:hypothetical protein
MTKPRMPIIFLPPSPPDHETEGDRLLRAVLQTMRDIRVILLRLSLTRPYQPD